MALTYFQRQRLKFIDETLCEQEYIKAIQVQEKFNICAGTVTRDFRLYKKMKPQNMARENATNIWIKTGLYSPLILE